MPFLQSYHYWCLVDLGSVEGILLIDILQQRRDSMHADSLSAVLNDTIQIVADFEAAVDCAVSDKYLMNSVGMVGRLILLVSD